MVVSALNDDHVPIAMPRRLALKFAEMIARLPGTINAPPTPGWPARPAGSRWWRETAGQRGNGEDHNAHAKDTIATKAVAQRAASEYERGQHQ